MTTPSGAPLRADAGSGRSWTASGTNGRCSSSRPRSPTGCRRLAEGGTVHGPGGAAGSSPAGPGWLARLERRNEAASGDRSEHGDRSGLDDGGRVQAKAQRPYAGNHGWNTERHVADHEDGGVEAARPSGAANATTVRYAPVNAGPKPKPATVVLGCPEFSGLRIL